MQNLTQTGQQIVNDLSQRYNLSQDAVMHMLIAVNNGAGTMAQFNCPELGGGGQWMAGGMTMVGDMFNYSLKNTVNNLCAELANALANNTLFMPSTTKGGNNPNWWPSDLGQPFSSGGQNTSRYAVFPNRLAVEVNGVLSVYDTLDHNIGGVSQQQGSNDSLVFNSQYGTISVSSLPLVSNAGGSQANNQGSNGQVSKNQSSNNQSSNNNGSNNHGSSNQNFMQPPEPFIEPASNQPVQNQPPQNSHFAGADDVLGIIEKLANLRDLGALSEAEYQNKKNDLLNRI